MIYVTQQSRSHIIQQGMGGKEIYGPFPPTLLSQALSPHQFKVSVDCLSLNGSFLLLLSGFHPTSHKHKMIIPWQKPWTQAQAVAMCLGCRRIKNDSNEYQLSACDYTNHLGPWKYLERIQLLPEEHAETNDIEHGWKNKKLMVQFSEKWICPDY